MLESASSLVLKLILMLSLKCVKEIYSFDLFFVDSLLTVELVVP